MFQAQQIFSVILGVLLLIWAISEITGKRFPQKFQLTGKISAWVRAGFGKWLGKGDPGSLFMIGLMNGLLPCGLVYRWWQQSC